MDRALENSETGRYLHVSFRPDRYFGAYVNQNFLAIILEKVSEVDQSIKRVQIVDPEACLKKPQEPKQLRLPQMPAEGSQVRSLHPRYTFEDFMVGESNILAQSACRSLSAF